MADKKHFIVRISSPRPDFSLENMTDFEIETMSDHFDYLEKLMAQGQLFLAGRCKDASYGIIIFKTDSIEEAKALIDNDPSIKRNVMSYEFHEFQLALLNH